MSKTRLSVVVTRRLPDPVETRLSELFDARLRSDDVPMTRAELGSSVGLAPETTSRVFQQFRRRALIEASGRNIRFLDPVGLRRLAVPLTHPGHSVDRTSAA